MSNFLESLWIEQQPNLWDQVVFQLDASPDNAVGSTVAAKVASALRFPFRCRYRGRFAMKVDHHELLGKSGGTTQAKGRNSAGIEFTVMLYEPEHLVLYGTFLRILQGQRFLPETPKVTVHHPALNLLGIDRLQFKSATLPTRRSSKDVLTSTLSFIEDLTPPPPIPPPAQQSAMAESIQQSVSVEPPPSQQLLFPGESNSLQQPPLRSR